MKYTNILYVYTDGGSSGNSATQGRAGTGALIYDEKGIEIARKSEYIGAATNNVAEYKALLSGITLALTLKPRQILCFTDSELIVKQINGEYRCKDMGLRVLLAEFDNLSRKAPISVQHLAREDERLKTVHKLVEKVIILGQRQEETKRKQKQEKQKTFGW
jgi:ribonuclease HI